MADPPGSEIVGYQVIVEREKLTPLVVFSADVSPATISVTVPSEFMEPGTEYKFEVLAIEASGNKTISDASSRRSGAPTQPAWDSWTPFASASAVIRDANRVQPFVCLLCGNHGTARGRFVTLGEDTNLTWSIAQ